MVSEPHPDLLHTVESDDFLPPVAFWTNFGSSCLVATISVAFILAALIKYDVTIKAAATVRPVGELRLVQATIEGTVKTILVKENQLVKQGDLIAVLDDSQLQTRKSQLQGNIQQMAMQAANITAQIRELDSQIGAQLQLMERTVASAQADLNLNRRDYRDKRITTVAEVQLAEAALELAQEQLKRYRQLGNTGAIPQLEIKEKEEAFKAAVAKLDTARTKLNPSNATVTIAADKIDQEKARGESIRATLNKERQQLVSRQVEMKNQISSAQKELKQVNTELQKTIIRATQAGTLLKLELRNPGQVVRPTEVLAQIAPGNASLVVKAHVSPQDIGLIKICQAQKVSNCKQGKAILRISAYPYPDYGTLTGAVRAITADAITPQGSTNAPYYQVTIQPDKLSLEKAGILYPIQPGMEVTADIISKQETILAFILTKARLITDL